MPHKAGTTHSIRSGAFFMPSWASPLDVLDLFAGPGGWDQGLAELGFAGNMIGVEWDESACATAEAAGHPRMCADVSKLNPFMFRGTRGHICSPPCQGFSAAGKGQGRIDAKLLLDGIAAVRTYSDAVALIASLHDQMKDSRSVLVLEPLRYALALTPSWLAWEQVPAVLPIWEACAVVLRRLGYTVQVAVVNAEQHGVPQTRRRAILTARSPWMTKEHGAAALPAPTHSKFYPRTPGKRDFGVRWLSMADALGWGMTHRPYPTIAAGTSKGGQDPAMLGGSGARQTVQAEADAGRWQFAGAGQTARKTAGQIPRDFDQPAHTITGAGSAAWIVQSGTRPWDANDPQSRRVTVQEAAVLQTFPDDYPWRGTKTAQYRQVGDAVPPRLASAVVRQNLLDSGMTGAEPVAA